MARKTSAKTTDARPRAPRPKRIIVIDDEIGADLNVRPHAGYNREDFLRSVGRPGVTWCFHDSFHSFIGDFIVEAAENFVANTPKADLILVDLMFGSRRTLGFDIIEMLQRSKHAKSKIALLTTHKAEDRVLAKGGATTVGAWVEQHGVGLISKDSLFQQIEFWRQMEPLLHADDRAKAKAGGKSNTKPKIDVGAKVKAKRKPRAGAQT